MKLIIVPTPVGNLEDITLRAIKVLKEADIILCEDTRTSGKLLKHYAISTTLWSYHMHNEHKVVGNIIEQLQAGKKICLITDAGTPGISDPGYLLIKQCIDNQVQVECLPGATAFVPALVISGLQTNSFVFEGFLPIKKGRMTKLQQLANEARTIILYESPHRLAKSLIEWQTYFGSDRKVAVVREISKMFEEAKRGSLAELAQFYSTNNIKGEIVVIIDGLYTKKKNKSSKQMDAEAEEEED